MNKVFDYNGTYVSPSKPVKQLKTVKKTLVVDSSDRDTTKFYTNGDFVVYLPRTYENVLSLRLVAGEFPPLVVDSGGAGAQRRLYSAGQNINSGVSWTDSKVVGADNSYYFLIDLEGLNKTDECTVSANRSTYPDSFFAKIPVLLNGAFIEYNDSSAQENIATYKPAIGKLDRLRIRTRLHSQQGNQGFIYWTSDGAVPGTTTDNQKKAEFSLTFEIEMLDNSFDDFSSFETFISDRK
jgi:hypothetical protein